MKRFDRRGKLSTKIAITTGIVTTIILTVLTLIVTFNVNAIVSKRVMGEFNEIAQNNGNSAQDMINSAERCNMRVVSYHEQHYGEFQSDKYVDGELSVFYNVPLSHSAYEAEKYYLNLAEASISSNRLLQGMGVYFEPYAFDKNMDRYSFYIYRMDEESGHIPELTLGEDYLQEKWYTEAVATGKSVVTEPYEEDGEYLVSIVSPLMYEGKAVGAVLVDIAVKQFGNIKAANEDYASTFSAIINNHEQFLFNSIDDSLVGQDIQSRFPVAREYERVKQEIGEGEEFVIDVTAFGGKKYREFFKPINVGETTWWSYTGVQHRDLMKDVYKLTVFMALASVFSLILLVSLSTMQIVKKLKPLSQLNRAADALSEGNFDYRITYQSEDEIGRACGDMSNAFIALQGIIHEISGWMKALENRDLTQIPLIEFHGEFEAIENSYKSLLTTLNHGFKDIKSSASQISLGADQVSIGAQTLAQGATEQAASVEELSATLTSITEKIRQNTLNASEVSELSLQVGDEIIESSSLMSELMQAMQRITGVSQEINNIIKTIDDIAFQTNILALNAAVEAARAGDAGKGFAVVADEVRNLAGKSAEAAKSTTALIENAIAAVEEGTRLAENTEKSLEKVVANAQIITGKIRDIATASEEQSEAVSQINVGADQIASVVQTNSATSEESAASSKELADQAGVLDALISQFKLIEQDSDSY